MERAKQGDDAVMAFFGIGCGAGLCQVAHGVV